MKTGVLIPFYFFAVIHPSNSIDNSEIPLDVDEVISCLRNRWKASYDLRLVVRDKRLYLQIMWNHLEQQSFPMSEEAYRMHLNDVIEVINRVGEAKLVRKWLATIQQKPRLGKAVSLPLETSYLLDEFVL